MKVKTHKRFKNVSAPQSHLHKSFNLYLSNPTSPPFEHLLQTLTTTLKNVFLLHKRTHGTLHTLPQTHNIATTRFPDAYNALLTLSELAWEVVSIPGFYQHALVLGYIIVAGQLHKVLWVHGDLDGAVRFITRSGLALKRAHNA